MADRALPFPRVAAIDWPAALALLLTCLAESAIAWLFAGALVSLTTDGRVVLAFWFPFALLLITALVPRLAFALESSIVGYETIVGAAAALTLVVSVKLVATPDLPWNSLAWVRATVDSLVLKSSEASVSAWIVAACVAAAWWRGRSRADPGVETSFQLLRFGIPLTFLGAALVAVMEQGPDDAMVARAALVFLVAALALLALVRLTGLGSQRARAIAPLDVVIAILPLLAIGLAGVVVVALVTGDVLATIVWALHPVFWLLTLLLDLVLLIVLVLVYLIVAPIFWLIGRGHFDFNSVRLTPATPLVSQPQQPEQGAPQAIPDPIRYAIAVAALLLLFAGVNRFLLRSRRRPATDPDEAERTSERPPFNLGALLANLLHAIDPRKKRDDDPLAHLRGDPRWAATVRIRERYADLLRWAAAHGQPRRLDQSPAEHRGTLQQRLAANPARAELATMTERYERARYATVPASPDDAAAFEAAWQRFTESTGSH